jgi:organic radical activating enzyme
LLEELRKEHFEVAVETNGSLEAPAGIDWICVSPKAGATWVQRRGHELKVVYPQPDLMPDAIGDVYFDYFLLQPMDGPQRLFNTRAAIAYCQANPRWRLSIQTHKILEIR